MIVVIEKGLPIPKGKKFGENEFKYPFHKLEVGDSFFLGKEYKNKVYGSMSAFHRTHRDKRFTTRAVDGGIRVWRIK